MFLGCRVWVFATWIPEITLRLNKAHHVAFSAVASLPSFPFGPTKSRPSDVRDVALFRGPWLSILPMWVSIFGPFSVSGGFKAWVRVLKDQED